MIKFIATILLLTIYSFQSLGQKTNKNYQSPNQYTIGVATGMTMPYHDVRSSEYGSPGELGYNIGFNISYWVSPTFAIRGHMGYGQVRGKITNPVYLSQIGLPNPVSASTIFYEGYIQGVINFSGFGLGGYRPSSFERKWNVFGTFGLGAVSYGARLRDIQTNQNLVVPDFGRSTGLALVAPVGLGLSYKVSPKFHIDLEANLRSLNTDAFDALVVKRNTGTGLSEPNFGRNLDKYGGLNITFVVHLGKNRQGESNYWNRSYLQQAYVELTEGINNLDNRLAEAVRKSQEQDNQLIKLNEKLTNLERQLVSSEAEMKKDTDGDGVPDVFDQEFTEWVVSDLEPSSCGWSEEEVKLLRDKAARKEKIIVDGNGVALDVDKDGIPDHLDKCPTTIGIPSCHGCKPEPKAETVKILTDLQSIEFESGLSDFVDCSKKRNRTAQEACRLKQDTDLENLNGLVRYLNEEPHASFKLRIVGHTDDVGSSESNMLLSEQRAASVKERLVGLGISADRIIIEGKGEEAPKFGPSGDGGAFTAADRSRNRRIELTIE